MVAPGRDSRPLVLALAGWAGAWAASSGDPGLWVGGAALVGILLVAAGFRRSLVWVGAALVLATALGGGVLRVAELTGGPLGELARQSAVVEVEARLVGGSRVFAATPTRPDWWVGEASVVALVARGERWTSGARVELSASGDAVAAWRALAPGTVVRVTVRLSPPAPDAAVAAQAQARGAPSVVAGPGPIDAAVARVRSGLVAASAALVPDARALVPALVVGDTTAMAPELVARFKATGLTHLTAVSGANLVLLLAFVRGAAVRLGLRGRRLTALSVATVLGFVALCLAEPSVVRAAAMGLVTLVGQEASGRGGQGLRYLAAAVLALVLWDPWIARSVGFALSVTASAGLLCWAGQWTDIMGRWAPRWLAEAVAVPLAAQLATQPLVTAVSGQISIVGLVANAVAAPLVGPATVFGFVAAGVSVASVPVASVLAQPAGWCAQGLCWIACLGDALPGATAAWPAAWYGLVLVALVCALLIRLVPLLLAWRWLTIACAVALILAITRTPGPPGWPPAGWSVVSCDVGQGDATVLRAGTGRAVVIDAGPDPALLTRCLNQLGVTTVPLVMLTHLHADHVTGLPAVSGRGVRLVVASDATSPTSGESLVDSLAASGAGHVTASAGSAWTVGQVRVEVLAAEPLQSGTTGAAEGESSAENDSSLLIRATVDGVSLLLAGDTEETGQARLRQLGDALDVDVLLVPHHGSSHQDPEFLAATSPDVALISVGAKNDYGHPTKRTLTVLARLTPNVVRTDQHGSIAIGRRDGALEVTAQR